MSDLSAYKCTPRQLREHLTNILMAGLVPFTKSSPGVGKSQITHEIAKAHNLELIDFRLSMAAPEDLSGLPEFYTDDAGHRRARFSPFNIFPLEGDELPEGKDGWLLFLDEFNSASKSVQAASYKLILDRYAGQYKLHENVLIVCAGNLSTDRAIVTNMSTAMQSRLVHLELEVNFQEWLEDVAFKQNYDSRIIAFLSQYPSKLSDFRPDHSENTFCCPRTWEFMNRLIKDQEVTESKAAMYAGTITSGIAVEFITFTKVFKNLVKVSQVIKDPQGTPVPQDNNSKWATIAHLMEHVTEDNVDALFTYASRFDMPFRVLFFRSVMSRQPHLRQHPAFASAMTALSRYLNG